MLPIHRQALPDRYLLTPTPDVLDDQAELERSLHRASRSDKPSIWLDFSLIDTFTNESIEAILAYAYFLRQVGRRLIVCHLRDDLQGSLEQLDPTREITIVPTLLDVVMEEKKSRFDGPNGMS